MEDDLNFFIKERLPQLISPPFVKLPKGGTIPPLGKSEMKTLWVQADLFTAALISPLQCFYYAD